MINGIVETHISTPMVSTILTYISIESLFDTPQTNIECQLHFDLKIHIRVIRD